MTKRPRTLVVLVLAMAVVVSSGIAVTFVARDQGPDSANVSPGRENSITSADGRVTVDVPGDAIDDPGTLTIAPIPGEPAAWDIDIEGTELVGEAVIRFTVDTSHADAPTPTVLYREDGQARQVVEDVERGDGEVSIHTTHFSDWWVIDWGSIKQSIVDSIGLSVGTYEDRAPTCQGESDAREPYNVQSDDGRRVHWCFGVEDGKTVLKAVNARQYGVAVESTPGLRLAHLDNTDLLGRIAKLLTPPPSLPPNTMNLLPSGDSVEFEITGEAPRVLLVFKPEPGAYLLSALKFGIDTYAMLLEHLGTTDADEHLRLALDGAACLDDLTGMMTTDLETAQQAQEFFGKALDASFSCVADVVREMDLGWVLSGVVQPVVWLVSGVKTAIIGFLAAGDLAFDPDGYQILVTQRPSDETSEASTALLEGIPEAHVIVLNAENTGDTFGFASPSGKLSCSFAPLNSGEVPFVECQGGSLQSAPDNNYCPDPDSYGITGVALGKKAGWLCAGGIASGGTSPQPWAEARSFPTVTGLSGGPEATLPYGWALTSIPITCVSRRSGVTCENTETGAKFTTNQTESALSGQTYTNADELSAELSAPGHEY